MRELVIIECKFQIEVTDFDHEKFKNQLTDA